MESVCEHQFKSIAAINFGLHLGQDFNKAIITGEYASI